MGQLHPERDINLAQDLTVFMRVPVRIEQVAGLVHIAATVYVTIGPLNTGTTRLAGAGECDIRLWDAPSSTWQPSHGLAAGGWNRRASSDTNSQGYAEVQDSVVDGWVRLVATHKPSGAQVAVAFRVDANAPVPGTITPSEVINEGNVMPAGYQQPQSYAQGPGSQLPARIPTVEWTPAGWHVTGTFQ